MDSSSLNYGDGALRDLARQHIAGRLAKTGQQVSAPVVEDAADLLSCIWTCGQAKGITVADWRMVAKLTQEVIDALAISNGREQRDD